MPVFWVGLVHASDGYKWGQNGEDYRCYVSCDEGEHPAPKLRAAIERLNRELHMGDGCAIAVVRMPNA